MQRLRDAISLQSNTGMRTMNKKRKILVWGRTRRMSGISLIEIMVAISITLLIILVGSRITGISYSAYNYNKESAEIYTTALRINSYLTKSYFSTSRTSCLGPSTMDLTFSDSGAFPNKLTKSLEELDLGSGILIRKEKMKVMEVTKIDIYQDLPVFNSRPSKVLGHIAIEFKNKNSTSTKKLSIPYIFAVNQTAPSLYSFSSCAYQINEADVCGFMGGTFDAASDRCL